MKALAILDLLFGLSVMLITFLGLPLALIGLLVWSWPWWAITISASTTVLGAIAWYGGVVGDEPRHAIRPD